MWQDYVITIVQAVFALAIVPTIAHPTQKPPISSCVITAWGMAVLTITYLSLGLWYSTILAIVVTVEWCIVGVQRYRLNQKEPGAAPDLPLGKWWNAILQRD